MGNGRWEIVRWEWVRNKVGGRGRQIESIPAVPTTYCVGNNSHFPLPESRLS